jgi:XRE family transcriptional regulator, regulator of sulfur utilization
MMAAVAVTGQPVSVAISPLTQFRPIGTTYVDWASLETRETPAGLVRSVFNAPTPQMERLEMHVTTLNPGKSPHPGHHHPWEEMLLIKEGALQVEINGVARHAGTGAFIFFASHDVHHITASGDGAATYYVINFYTAATYAVPDQPAAASAPADRLHSRVVNWEDAIPKEFPNGIRRSFVDSPTLTFTHLEVHASTVAPGTRPIGYPGHLHPILIIVKEGTMEYAIDGVTHLVGPGSLVYIAPGSVQVVRNPGTVPATYYVISVSSAETPIGG